MTLEKKEYLPIEDYALVGDLHTVALVGKNGSVDFLCLPDFDSPSVFAALLDKQKGGFFQITPKNPNPICRQIYLPDTNILFTRFFDKEGISEISDLMPITDEYPTGTLIRRVKSVRGEVKMQVKCAPRFDYARASHRIEKNSKGYFFTSDNEDPTTMRLHSDIDLKEENGDLVGEFTLKVGQTIYFVIQMMDDARELFPITKETLKQSFFQTANYWRNWVSHSSYRGKWEEMVHRSVLTLKLLTSKKYGSIVAAPTFGFPEEIGGERNWDYRYTWIRDASFTLYGLIRLGFTEEAGAFMKWIEARCYDLNPDGSLQIMYGIDGRKELTEINFTHLEGYKKSAPVRIGNGAYDQLQLDIYGELMDAVYLYDKYGEPISFQLWEVLKVLINWVCKNWRKKDEGIWEVRGGTQEFLYSRLMCWVALDRGIRLANKRSLPAPTAEWLKVRDEIHNEINTNFWSTKRNSYTQHKKSETIDASNLLMPLVKFISPTDPRWLGTMKATEQDLVDDSLVYRYKIGDAASDGLEGEEGTFSMCGFWYAECLSRGGDLDKARFHFEKMLSYSNHVGLYAEELGPHGEHLGNFPQAFTHLGLISTAANLSKNLR